MYAIRSYYELSHRFHQDRPAPRVERKSLPEGSVLGKGVLRAENSPEGQGEVLHGLVAAQEDPRGPVERGKEERHEQVGEKDDTLCTQTAHRNNFV